MGIKSVSLASAYQEPHSAIFLLVSSFQECHPTIALRGSANREHRPMKILRISHLRLDWEKFLNQIVSWNGVME